MKNTVLSKIIQKEKNDHSLSEHMLQKSKEDIPACPSNLSFLSTAKLPTPLSGNDFIEVLGLYTRLENTLKKGGKIQTIGQFMNLSEEELMKIKYIGYKSMEYLRNVRKTVSERLASPTVDNISENTFQNGEEEEIIPGSQLIDLLMDRCNNDRGREIIKRRYGLMNGEKETLEEIGKYYGITRERIRQIQAKMTKRMKHPITKVKKPIVELVEKMLFENGGILTEEEADKKIPSLFGGINHDGSSLLDMFSDLSWIQSHKIGDIIIYAPNLEGISLREISKRIISLIKKESIGITVDSIKRKMYEFSIVQDGKLNPYDFVLRYCLIDPRIEEVQSSEASSPDNSRRLFRHYTVGHSATRMWIALIYRVFEEAREPLHFTEVTDMVNDLIENEDRKLDARRAHCILTENVAFAHSGIRGTYGLSSWGLRKESTPELVEECLNKAGFPLHWRQIYNYVSKYKDSKAGNIIAILENHAEFERKGNGVYGFKSSKSSDFLM